VQAHEGRVAHRVEERVEHRHPGTSAGDVGPHRPTTARAFTGAPEGRLVGRLRHRGYPADASAVPGIGTGVVW
jgi:hypothetical protein